MTEKIGLEGVLELDGFDQGMKSYMSGIDQMNGKTEKAAGTLSKTFDSMGEKVNSVATKMGTAIVAGAAVASAALVGWAAKGVTQAMDMEEQLGKVAVLLHKTTAEVKPLEQEIVKLALDPKLAVNTQQAADTIQELAKQGFTMDQILQGGARSAIVLANATGSDVVQAANLAKNTIDSFNLSTDDMGRVTQGIAAVVNSTEMSFEDYDAAINQAGSTIISTGISFEDFNTVLAATTDYTKSGGDAGKTFTQIIQKMTAPTDQAKAAMKELGITFTDANGKMLPIPQILKNIETGMASSHSKTVTLAAATNANSKEAQHYASVIKATQQKLKDYQTGVAGVAQSENDKKVAIDRLNRVLAAAQAEYVKYGGTQAGVTKVTTKLTEAQKQHDLELIFGTKAMREVNGLLALGSEGYTKLQESLAKRSAEEDAATRMDNFKMVIQNLYETLDALTLQIGIAFLPMVTEMGKKVAQFLSDHGEQLVDFFKTVADVITALVSGTPTDFPWEDVFPPWLADRAYDVSKIIEGVGMVVSDFSNGLVGYDYPWEDVFPPWLATTAYKIADSFQFVEKHLAAFQGALMGVAVVLAGAGIYSAIGAIVAAISTVSVPVVAIIGAAALLGAAWNDNWFGIRDATMPIIEALGTGLEDLWTVVSEFTTGSPGDFPWEDIFPAQLADTMYALSDGITAVKEAFQPLTDAITENGPGALNEIKNFATGNETNFANVKAIWDGVTQAAKNIFEGIAPIVSGAFVAFQAAIAPWAEAAIAWITTAVQKAPAKLLEWYVSLTGFLSEKLGEWVSYLIDWSDPLVNWIGTAVNMLGGKIGEWYTALTGFISSHVGEWVSYLIDWSDPLVNWIDTSVSALGTKIGEWYTALTGYVSAHIGEWVSYLIDWSSPLVDWIATAITNLPGKIAEWFLSLTSSVSSYVGEWVSYLIDWSDPLVAWISTAISGIGPKILEWYTNLTTSVSSHIGEWVSYLMDWSEPLINWVSTAVTNIPAKIAEWYNALTGEIDTWLPTWVDYLLGWSDPLIDWVGTAITNIPGKILEWYTALSTSVSEHIGEWVSYLIDWSSPLVDWISTAITNAPGKIAEWYTALTTSVGSWLPTWLDTFFEWSDAAVDWIATAITNLSPKMGEFMLQLMASVAAGYPNFLGAFLDYTSALTGWITTAVLALPTTLGGFTSKLTSWGTGEGLNKIAETVAGFANKFLSWVDDDLIPKIGPAMGRILADMVLGIGVIVAGVGKAAIEIGGAIFRALTETDWQAVGEDLVNLVIKGFKVAGHLVESIFKGFADEIKKQLNLPDWNVVGKNLITGFTTGVTSMLATVQTSFGTVVNTIINYFTEIDWGQLGTDLIQSISNATIAAVTYLGTGIDFIIQYVVSSWTSTDWGKIGTDLINAIRDFAVTAASELYTKIQGIIDTVKKKFTDFDWTAAGKAIIDGLKKGIDNQLQSLWDKVAGIVSKIQEKIKNALGVNSPAKTIIPFGEAIVEGLIVGVQNKTSALMQVLGRLTQEAIAMFNVSSQWAKSLEQTNKPLEDFSTAFSDIVDLGKNWAELFPQMKGVEQFTDSINYLDTYNTKLQDRIKLMDIMKKYNLNPRVFLNGASVDTATPEQISAALLASAETLSAATRIRLGQEQRETQRIYDMQNALTKLNAQTEASGKLGNKSMNFFQNIEFSQLEQKFTSLGEKIEKVKKKYIETGDVGSLNQMNQLLRDRDTLLANMQVLQNRIGDTAQRSDLTEVINQQSSMLDQAAALGMDVNKVWRQYFNNVDNFSVTALRKMASLKNDLDAADFDVLRKKLVEKGLNLDYATEVTGFASNIAKDYASKVLDPLLQKLRSLVLFENYRNYAIDDYNKALQVTKSLQAKQTKLDYLQQQTDLINQAKESGLDLSKVLGGITFGPNANVTDLMVLSNKLMDAMINKAQAALTPEALALADKQMKRTNLTTILNQQSTMLEQAKKLGWNVNQVWSQYFNNADQLSSNAIQRMNLMQDSIDEANLTALKKELIEKGLAVDLDSTVSGVSASLAKQYTETVLDPLLAKLRDVLLIEKDRNVALSNYNNALGITKTLQGKQDKLNFLQMQIDLLDKAKAAGMNLSTLFAGITLGPGANITDLLVASNKLMDQLVNKAQEQLTPQAMALNAHQQQVDAQKAQLDLLNRQLDIIHQGQQAGVNWEGFFSGLTTGVNASEEDILTATGRLYAKLIKQALKELGIASPSKVMMKIGRQTIQGLGIGMGEGFRNLGSYISSVPQGPVSNRSVSMSMGGVSIYSGMDEVMFENRVQRVIERALN